MKKITASLLAIIFLAGCKTAPISQDAQITLGASLGSRIAIGLVGSTHRKQVANYMYVISNIGYSLTVAPTPDGLTQLILTYIPASELQKYPEIQTLVIPAVVDTYKSYYDQYASNQKALLQVIKDIATGVSTIASQYK